MNDECGDTASHLIFMMPTAEAAKKFQAASKEAGAPCAIIADNTWHYAKHWDALREMSGKEVFGTIAPSYEPESMLKTEAVLSRAVMFGLNLIMEDEASEKIINAVKAGAKAAL